MHSIDSHFSKGVIEGSDIQNESEYVALRKSLAPQCTTVSCGEDGTLIKRSEIMHLFIHAKMSRTVVSSSHKRTKEICTGWKPLHRRKEIEYKVDPTQKTDEIQEKLDPTQEMDESEPPAEPSAETSMESAQTRSPVSFDKNRAGGSQLFVKAEPARSLTEVLENPVSPNEFIRYLQMLANLAIEWSDNPIKCSVTSGLFQSNRIRNILPDISYFILVM
ncbi:unnamed protein product [Haemonchus placei]|uniref:BESS domain-containing protein n=1 Tax=Haemonchus placei TaxID=6290 RepID=A0A0N4X9T1_HAEPC|nr:unnamed protein product [Haemonchus placei]